MNIEYIPLRKDILAYKIIGDIIYAKCDNKVYKVDFSNFEDGKMINNDIEFLAEVYKKDGILNITLRKPVNQDGNEIPQEDFSTDKYEKVKIKWKTQEEIKEEELLKNLIPDKEEVEKAELEISVINLLQDLEVI